MIFNKTKLAGVWIIQLEPRVDERGFFVRNFAKEELATNGIDYDIVHIDRSLSVQKGTTRGLHFQRVPKAEDKIIQCLRGKIFNVVVDIRKGSPTYGDWLSVVLDPHEKNMILSPKGCVNGIQTLEDNSELQYFITEHYSPEHASGFRWNDPFFGIEWPFKVPSVISEKDAHWPLIDKNAPPVIAL